MDVQETRLRQILEGSKQYRVPLYQRPYSWKSKQLERLWADLLDLAEARRTAPTDTHFTGSLVLSLGAVGPGGSDFLVVDGQQRLTTLTILLCAIRDHIEDNEPENSERRAQIHESFIINRFRTGDARLKLLPTQADRDSFQALVDRSSEPSDDTGVAAAYKFFHHQLKLADDPDDPHDIRRIEEAALDGLAFVSITARGDDNVYRIFESLNNTGMKLTQGDLLRNYIFMRLGKRGEDAYTALWLPMQSRLSSSDLEALFWMDIVIDSPEVKQGDIYAAQQDRLHKLTDDEVFGELKRFSRLSILLKLMRNPSKEADVVQERLGRLRDWGTAAVDPLVLHLLDRREHGTATDAEVAGALAAIESFLVRRLIVGASGNALSRILLRAASDLRTDVGVDAAVLNYLSTGRKFFATDDQVRKAVLTQPFYYTGRPSQKKQLLQWLEETYGSNEPIDLSKATIEHVMPQTLGAEWRSSIAAGLQEGESVDDVHDELLHTLGNLTLTGYNSELSNHPFGNKKVQLALSGVRMNTEIAANDTWGRNEIEKRAGDLADRLVATWVAPTPTGDVIETGVKWLMANDAVAAVTAGEWTTYGDIAALVGTHPVPLGQYIAQNHVPSAWRVLQASGSVSPGFQWAADSPHLGADPREVLRAEGVRFDGADRADVTLRVRTGELARRIGMELGTDLHEGSEDILDEGLDAVFQGQLADHQTPAVVHGVIEVMRSWERMGGFLEFGRGEEMSCFLTTRLHGQNRKTIWPMAIYPGSGSVEVVFQHLSVRQPFDSREMREELRERLSRVRGVDLPSSKLDARPSFSVDALADENRRAEIVDVLEWFLGTVASASRAI